jgi:UDP-N-acetylmuramoyl-L-alanyl-D-glutamate--2,6-diaminopimelate ligase
LDSRRIEKGDAFIALKGGQVNGEEFIADAISQGASVILRAAIDDRPNAIEWINRVPVVDVLDLNRRLSSLASRFYCPSMAELSLIGVTGTNGKTTVTTLLAQACALLGAPAGVIGTLGVGVVEPGSAEIKVKAQTGHTTPDAISVQKLIADLLKKQCKTVSMEVSSHALSQYRVEAVPFSIAVLTNVSRDHLDYHGTMQAYIEAKAQLLKFPSLQTVVLNLDDDVCASLIEGIADNVRVLTYSLQKSSASVYAIDVEYGENNTVATVVCGDEQQLLRLPLLGEFNLSNALAVISCMLAQGFEFKSVIEALASIKGVVGRMQRVTTTQGDDIHVVVDYAHTPQALESVLHALQLHNKKQILCVFGCGGNRDTGKRPLMGAVACDLAHRIYLTSDNPRDEKPQAIVDDILNGIKTPNEVLVELDRETAIRRAISEADVGDWVLIAGKGHEQTQEISGEKHPFSDQEIAIKALQARMAA